MVIKVRNKHGHAKTGNKHDKTITDKASIPFLVIIEPGRT
jgi:hypothetical protein